MTTAALCEVCDEPGAAERPLGRHRDVMGRAVVVAHADCAADLQRAALRERAWRWLTGRRP